MGTNVKPPWVDGEKIPDDRVTDIYKPPPGVPDSFYRSTLVVGSRGAGKTTLFRYLRQTHIGLAIHLSLTTEFASLTKQTGLGPLTTDVPAGLQTLVAGKATALLVASIAERLSRRDISIPLDAVVDALPDSLKGKADFRSIAAAVRVRETVTSEPLGAFQHVGQAQSLAAALTAIGEATQGRYGPLLVLLDRADMVLTPSLRPVFEALDQSSNYVALVAMRPGHSGRLASEDSAVPGDHYAVIHLGIQPRSEDWIRFVEDALTAQLGSQVISMPKRIKNQVIAVSRDSLRTALELSARYLSARTRLRPVEFVMAVEDLKENQMAAAQRTLQRYHPDFRELVAKIRGVAIERHGRITGPVLLTIEEQIADTLFSAPNPLHRFIEAGLRCGAVCMREGERWIPGLYPRTVEIAPLMLWDKTDGLWEPGRATPVSITWTQSEVFRRPGGPMRQPSIFVAFRMDAPESQHFRGDLEDALSNHPEFAAFRVTDGRVPPGAHWPTIIRDRIKTAKAVVADVTAMRPDVLFELGFSYGLGRVRIPAISSETSVSSVPAWLGATQLGKFGSDIGVTQLLSGLVTHLSDPELISAARGLKQCLLSQCG